MSLTNFIKNLLFPTGGKVSPGQKKKFKKRWRKIERNVNEGGENNFRVSIIEADKLIKDGLESLGYRQETWAKTLAQAEPEFSNSVFQGLWQAHKARNRVVHDSDHELNSMEAKSAIKKYRRGLKELTII